MKRASLSSEDFCEKDIILRDCAGLIDIADIACVEFTFGSVRKLYPQQVSYHEQRGVFTVRFDAEEAAALLGVTQYQARIKFTDGSVKATALYTGKILGCGRMGDITLKPPFSVDGCSGVARNGKRLAQGDTYELPVVLKRGGTLVTPENVRSIEFRFGTLRKRYPDEVSYDGENGVYLVMLSQQETFAFERDLPYYAIIEETDGAINRSCMRAVSVERSISKEVL